MDDEKFVNDIIEEGIIESVSSVFVGNNDENAQLWFDESKVIIC